MSNPIENLKGKIENIIELELLENKINKDRINRIRIKKIKELIRKGLKELETKKVNKIKDLEETETQLRKLEIKVIKER